MESAQTEATWPCPKGCGREFKTRAAAAAHAVHCRHQPESEPTNGGQLDADQDPVVHAVVEAIMPHIQQGMAGLQERIQSNIAESIMQALPQMVAQETAGMADRIAEAVSKGPGDGAAGLGNLMGTFNAVNALLETPLGKIIQQHLLPGNTRKGSPVSMRGLSRGMGIANRMLFSRKADMPRMAELIMAAADAELKDRQLDSEARDLMLGMRNTAQLALAASRTEPEAPAGPAGGER